jgi:hypothetical protein
MKKILIIVLVVSVLITILVLASGKGGQKEPLPTPIPLPTGYEQNYSNLNLLKPGESTVEDVIAANGEPKSRSSSGDRVTLTFETPNSSHQNIAVFNNGILLYAVEYVYADYRGNLSDYIKTYGTPEKMYSEPEEGFDWFIFLDNGVGVESSNDFITRIVYFVPQDRISFLQTIGEDLEIIESAPEPHEEELPQP